MANFCTKCGAGISAETKFCTGCGAPVGGLSAATTPLPAAGAPRQDAATPGGFAPVNAPGSYSQPGSYGPPAGRFGQAANYGQPVVTPPPKSGGALKIVLIVVGVIVAIGLLIGMLGVFAAWRFSRAIKVNSNGDGVTLNTPGGTFTAGNTTKNLTEAEVGAPIYPGAKGQSGGLNIKTAAGSMSTTIFTTSDSPEQVIDFYKGKLGSEASIVESGDGAVLTLGHNDNEGIMVTVGKDHPSGKTQISITHTKTVKKS